MMYSLLYFKSACHLDNYFASILSFNMGRFTVHRQTLKLKGQAQR